MVYSSSFIVVVFSGISAKNVFKFWIEDEVDYNKDNVSQGKKEKMIL